MGVSPPSSSSHTKNGEEGGGLKDADAGESFPPSLPLGIHGQCRRGKRGRERGSDFGVHTHTHSRWPPPHSSPLLRERKKKKKGGIGAAKLSGVRPRRPARTRYAHLPFPLPCAVCKLWRERLLLSLRTAHGLAEKKGSSKQAIYLFFYPSPPFSLSFLGGNVL